MPTDRDYLKRLAELNGRPLEHVPDETESAVRDLKRKLGQRPPARPVAPAPPVVYERGLPRAAGPAKHPAAPSATPVALEQAVSGVEVELAGWGRAFLVARTAADMGREGAEVCRAFRARCEACESPAMIRARDLCNDETVRPQDLLFLDLETAGLSNAPVFLVGLLYLEEEGLALRQYLARTYAEEACVTALFAAIAAGRRLLISYNGKTFDLPYLRTRAAATGVPFRCDLPHMDLLHVCRRAWRGQVPDHRLQTLERWICRRFRNDDIPGHAVPEAYHAFVRTGDATQMARILHHNALDLLTLAELFVKVPGGKR